MFRGVSIRKVVLYVVGGGIALLLIVFGLRFIKNNQYSSNIPELPESTTLSVPVKEQIAKALTSAHRHPSADNLGMLGMVYHSSANYEQAAQCYKLAIRRDQSEWIWNYYLGFLYKEMSNSDAVIDNFSVVTEKNPNIYHAWYYLGGAYRNLRKIELAEKSFGKITGILNSNHPATNTNRYDYFPLGTYAKFQLARLYNETDRTELAEETLKDIIKNNRSFGPAYRLLGNIYSAKGDSVLSKRYGVRANDLVVFSPPVDTLIDRLVSLSKSELYLLKKIDEAERSIYPEWAMQLINIAVESIPDNKYLVSKAIKTSLMLNLDEKAAAYADQHIGYFQDNFSELNNMGILFFQKRLYPQSMKYLTRARVLKPQDVDIQNSLAICYWYIGDKQKSLEILDEVIEENQENPDVLANVTNLMFDLGEDEKARSQLNNLKQVAPENPKVLNMSAGIAEQAGNYKEAISLYESSFITDPEDLSTIRFLGNLLFRQKMWEKYIKHFRTALEYHPNDPYLLERLGTMLVSCPDPAWRNTLEGRDYSERAFIHTTSRSITLISAGRSLALAYAELGDKQNATTVIRMTINIARRENISESYQKDLENISRRVQTLEN
jgi:tetratricopeptide (TPR) repeat protein